MMMGMRPAEEGEEIDIVFNWWTAVEREEQGERRDPQGLGVEEEVEDEDGVAWRGSIIMQSRADNSESTEEEDEDEEVGKGEEEVDDDDEKYEEEVEEEEEEEEEECDDDELE